MTLTTFKDSTLKLVTPFKGLTQLERILSTTALILLLFIGWSYSGNKYIPAPLEVLGAFPTLFSERDLVRNFAKSLLFCFEAMAYSSAISFVVCYLSVLPLFASAASFMRKFRFLPSAGLSFLFLKLSGGTMEGEMQWMMVFGVTTWLLDSMLSISLGIKPEEIMYAKSLRLNRWQMMREVLIYGKAADLCGAIVGNFAMAWMLLASVENIAKASGGIGVVLQESAKYYKYDQVYAAQFLILGIGNLLDLGLYKVKTLPFNYLIALEVLIFLIVILLQIF